MDKSPFEHINPEEYEQIAIIGRKSLRQWKDSPEILLARELFGVFLDWIEASNKAIPAVRRAAASFAERDKAEQEFTLEMFGHILNQLMERSSARQADAALCRAVQFSYRIGLLAGVEGGVR